ncbi:MAG TPA: hypothetical protein VIL18_13935 [Longimicrobiales bacterium]
MSMPGFSMIQAAAPALELTAGALVFMLGAMGAVTALTGWCFARILKGRRHFDPDGTGPAHSPVQGTAER